MPAKASTTSISMSSADASSTGPRASSRIDGRPSTRSQVVQPCPTPGNDIIEHTGRSRGRYYSFSRMAPVRTTDPSKSPTQIPGNGLPKVDDRPEDASARLKLIEALRSAWVKEIESMSAYREL